MRPQQLRLWEGPVEARPAGALLREARRRAELSQRALAGDLGVDQATVSRLECGRLSLTFEHAILAAAACQVPVEAILGTTSARARRHRSRGAALPVDRSRTLAARILASYATEYVRRGGSLRAARMAECGRQPLSAGQAAVALSVLSESGRGATG